MSCFLVVIRNVIPVYLEAAVSCRKVVAAGAVGETHTQANKLLLDQKGKEALLEKGPGGGIWGQHTVWEPRGLLVLWTSCPPSLKWSKKDEMTEGAQNEERGLDSSLRPLRS